jgi:hypothetical protein
MSEQFEDQGFVLLEQMQMRNWTIEGFRDAVLNNPGSALWTHTFFGFNTRFKFFGDFRQSPYKVWIKNTGSPFPLAHFSFRLVGKNNISKSLPFEDESLAYLSCKDGNFEQAKAVIRSSDLTDDFLRDGKLQIRLLLDLQGVLPCLAQSEA